MMMMMMMMMMMWMMMRKRLAQVPMLCVPIYNMKLAMMQTTPIFTTFSAHTKMAADERGQNEVFARNIIIILLLLFPTCQVRVVRFYVSCLPLPLLPSASASCLVLVLLVQLRSAIHIVRCRTSTTTIHAQRSLPDLNHDHPRPVFPAGPQPRPSAPSVPCRTSTTTIPAQCSLPDLNREYPRQVFPAGPHVGRYST